MALTNQQRLDRLKVRLEELAYWRAREGVPVTGWTTDGSGSTAWTRMTPPSGTGLTGTVWGIPNNTTTSDRGLISPAVAIPVGAQATILSFDTYHHFEDNGPGSCWDNGTLQLKGGSGGFAYVDGSRLFTDAYDGIVAWGLLFLLAPDVQLALIRKAAGMLRMGGSLVFTAPAERGDWTDVLTRHRSISLGAPEYRRALEDAGLRVVREADDEGENHYYFAVR